MTESQIIAIKCAAEITAAKVTNASDRTYSEFGKDVAGFFEVVYNKIYEISSRQE